MKPTNLFQRAWKALSGTRLTVACIGLLIAYSAAIAGLALWESIDRGARDLFVGSTLRLAGLSGTQSSGWFMSLLVLLGVNLFCGILAGLPEAWREASSAAPLTDPGPQALRSELETEMDRETFAVFARRWCKKKLGSAQVTRQNPGTLLLSVKRGRFNGLLRLVAHLALGLALAGGVRMLRGGFQAQVLVEEGARAGVVELIAGAAPASWKPFQNQGKIVPGYFDPGFEIARLPGTEAGGASLFRFYEAGQLVEAARMAPGLPGSFRGLALHLLDYESAGSQNIRLTATARATGEVRRFGALSKGDLLDLEDFAFKVLEIQPQTEINGPAVQVEYEEKSSGSKMGKQRFWVFQDYRDYDFAHRKASAQHFTLEAITRRSAARVLIGQAPGAGWLFGGLTALAFLFWAALARPEERFWIRWHEGGGSEAAHRVELVGWSPRPLFFEPRFYQLADRLERSLAKGDAADDVV